MQAPLFIVWRESLEALLIIGILYNWMRREKFEAYIPLIWLGTGLGLLLSAILALTFWFASQWFSGPGGEWFFIGMAGFASLLILQMVTWMHHHGKNVKSELESQAKKYMQTSDRYGIILLSMLAVAREGSETVIFLAGVGTQQQGSSIVFFIIGAVLGLALALFTFWFLQKFTNLFSWRWFFIITEYALLLIGGGLLVTAIDRMSGQLANYDLPDWAYNFMDNPVWDSSWLLSDGSTLTGLTGYHATPSLMQVLTLVLYWGLALFLLYRSNEKLKISNKTITSS